MQAVLTVLPVFILIVAGWFLRQNNRLSPLTVKENNFLLYWLAIPAVLLRGILSADTGVLRSASFLAAVWLPYIITITAAWITARRKTGSRFPVEVLCSIRGNHFFAGLPIVALAMGQRGTEAGTLILACSLVVMQLLSIGGAQLAMFGSVSRKTLKGTCMQLLKNPLFLSCVLGLLLIALGLDSMPAWLDATLGIAADLSTGVALLGLGAGIHLDNAVKTAVSVWRIILLKLILCPVVTCLVYTSFGLSLEMIQAGVLLAGMPVSINTAIVAEEMGMDSAYCGMAIAVTTLVSMLTLPLTIRLLGLA